MLQACPRTPVPRPALALAAVVALLPAAARAGEAPCWFEQGVVVVPAVVAGVAGDYILDTGAPATLLDETRAQGAGFEASALQGEVRVAGLRLPDRPILVADLDARTAAFPTPIAGVIGADVLAGRILDIDFAPCRIALNAEGRSPRFHADGSLPFRLDRGTPVIAAAVADGPRALSGGFVASTGADAPVRLDGSVASVPGAPKPERLAPFGPGRASLRALSVGGILFENLKGGLSPASEGATLGVIGAQVLAHWTVRFDFVGAQLLLAKKKGPPDLSDEP